MEWPGRRVGKLRVADQSAHLGNGRLLARLRQTLDGDVAAQTQSATQALQRHDERTVAEPANEQADAFVARVADLVHAQGFLATQVQRQVGAFALRIGFELAEDLGGDGHVGTDPAIEADPGLLFLELDAGALRTKAGFLEGHGVDSNERGNTHPRRGDSGLPGGGG